MSDEKLRYQKITDMATVEAVVLKGIESARTMRARVQYAAIALMIGSTFDTEKALELANKLANELGQGVKAEGLVKFMTDKAGFRLNEAGDAFASVKNEEWIRANLESAKTTPWWTYAPATPFKAFTLNEEIRKIVKTAKAKIKHAEKHPEDANLVTVDTSMITVLEALVGGNPVPTEGAVHLIERILPHDEAERPGDVVSGPAKEAPQAANA